MVTHINGEKITYKSLLFCPLMSNAPILGFQGFNTFFLKISFQLLSIKIKDKFGDSEWNIAILNITIKLKQSGGQ